MSNASVPYDKLDALAGECELMEGQGLTFMPGVMGRRLRALLAEAREKLAAEPDPRLREELALYREEYEARHSYGHKQGITSPQAKRYQEAKRKLIVFRALARTPPQKGTMTIKLGYCIHCGQANITCINTQKDGTMTHYSIAKQGECGPLIIDDVEIPETNWAARTPPQKGEKAK